MPEYIQYNVQGRIVNKWYSADPHIVEGLPNILQISRDVFNSLTKFYMVDGGVLREMTQSEKDTLLAEEAQVIIDAENTRIQVLDNKMSDDLSSMILTKADVAINNIGNLADAKTFLKKLCRYIIKFVATRQ